MESLSKKSPAGMSGISFASAAAGKGSAASSTAAPAVAAAASTAGTPNAGGSSGPTAKNGSNASSRQSSPALGSQSPALGADKDSSVSQSGASGTIDWVLGKHVKVVTLADEVYEGQVYAFDVIMNCVCPSKLVSASPTPAAYYSPSLGGNSPASRQKYDFRILKINYIKEVSPIQDAEAVSTNTAKAGEDLAATTSTSAKSNEGSAGSSPNPASTTTTTAAAAAATKESGDVKETKEGGERNTATSGGGSNVTNNIYSSVLPAVGFVHLDRIRQREQQAVREAQAAAARIGVGVSTVGQEIFDALSKTLPCRWAKDSIVVMDEVIIAPPYEPENCKANASSSYTLARVKKVLEGERSRMANGRK
ncbi:hypothetical protein BGZ68_004200 [Mortierella alpina]|nr:hypothetical protein BGZ68_004200 [Mortierella alpina]